MQQSPANADGSFSVTNVDQFMSGVNTAYNNANQILNPATAQSIRNYVTSQKKFDMSAGVPGVHAEVQSLNNIYNSVPGAITNPSKINISTYKLGPTSSSGQQGGPFQACTNCGAIIPPNANITSGKVP